VITSLLRDPSGNVTRTERAEPIPKDKATILWVDFRQPTPDEANTLRSKYGFNEFAVDYALDPRRQPKLDQYGSYLFITVQAVTLSLEQHTFATHQISFFLGPNYVVSVHTDPIASVGAVRDEILDSGRMRASADLVLHAVLDQLIDNYAPIVELLERHINNAEDVLLRSVSRRAVGMIFELKRDVMRLRRVTSIQREVMHRLSRDPSDFIPVENQVFFRDLYDSVFHVYELSNWFREMITGLLEVHLTSISNRTNEIMRILTIIAVVGMPLTLIAGIYGTNFSSVPFMRSGEFLPRYGFWVMIALMAAVVIATLTWFKIKKWF
jgi:magnesium transporter